MDHKTNEGKVLLTSKWTGAGPYAAFTPEPNSHTLGCWSTSLAQIMYFHRLQPAGTVDYTSSRGYHIQEDLSKYTFDWQLFADSLTHVTPDTNAEQIARYCYSAATIVQKDFGTGRYMTKMPSLKNLQIHLPVKCSLYLTYNGWMHSKAKLKNLVIHEIEANRPLFFYYRNMHVSGSGHSVVIDGYKTENGDFLVHLNFGWEGENDGWYPMFDDIATPGDCELRFWITIRPTV